MDINQIGVYNESCGCNICMANILEHIKSDFQEFYEKNKEHEH